MRRLVIAGVQSGTGKTTIATGIMSALATRMRVQGFKAGPDYIDPTYHTRVCGRASRNLDTWMLPDDRVLELFGRAASTADIAIVEGVMGLYDGRSGGGDAGSTASVAKLLAAPVVLVLDAAKIARTAAAIVLGLRHFDPRVNLAGVILNRIASQRHYDVVAGAIEQEAGLPVLGALPRDEDLTLPERYLGLIPTVEGSVADRCFDRLRAVCERAIDLARLEQIASSASPLPLADSESGLFPALPQPARVRIGVARDAAFSFYYEDNLDLLRAWGAEIVEFSPLRDRCLPPRCDGLYFGGGFPELYAAELAGNGAMLSSLRAAVAAGMPLYAECGGLMYLGERLRDAQGSVHELAGILPSDSTMQSTKLTLGYRELRAACDSLLLRAGEQVHAHEFHWSALAAPPAPAGAAYVVSSDGDRREGFARGNLLATYMHLHFAAGAAPAPRFVAACERWQHGRDTVSAVPTP